MTKETTMTTKRKVTRSSRPPRKQQTNGKVRQPSIHLVRIASTEARKQAFSVLIDLEEMWVRLPENKFGLSTRQVTALEKGRVPFEIISKSGSNAKAV
jgi:hypothetical protein